MTATQRTLNLLRKQGYFPWIVEKFNGFSGRRTDLFNIIDILVLTPKRVIGVQSTGVDFSGHKKKLLIDEQRNTIHWLSTKGNDLFIIGWRKTKLKRLGKRFIYKPRIGRITLENNNLFFQEMDSPWLRKTK